MKNIVLCILAIVWTIFLSVISGSLSVCLFLFFVFATGFLLCQICKKNQSQYKESIRVFIFSFFCSSLVSTLYWLDIEYGHAIFFTEDNDHFLHWQNSLSGVTAQSIGAIFRNCFVDDVFSETGGYFFYIQTIAYLANKFSDGNHILLQALGSSIWVMYSSIVIYHILSYYSKENNTFRSAVLFSVCSPLVIVGLGIHRDPIIAFLYIVLIYLFLTKNYSVRIALCQLLIALIIYTIRPQHGLFALSFIIFSALSSNIKYKWVYYFLLGAIIVVYGRTLFLFTNDELSSTMEFYKRLGEEALKETDSGIGRYVYSLPTPIRQIAQIVVLQMQFPPWFYLKNSVSIYGSLLGVFFLIINVLWMYIFTYTVIMSFKVGLKQIPKHILWGLVIFVLFLFLNSSNMILRRVVCVYPFIYIGYVYLKDNMIPIRWNKQFRSSFCILYIILCFFYLLLKIIFS